MTVRRIQVLNVHRIAPDRVSIRTLKRRLTDRVRDESVYAFWAIGQEPGSPLPLRRNS
jgi:hypothetical protein